MSDTIISIRELSKSFGDHEVLKKIDIDVSAGEIICIVGSSGSGKSTLLRCINKLERQTTGKILYHDKEVRDVQKEINEYRSKVGMVFQSFNLFNNMTVLENCMLCTRKVLHLPKEEAFKRAIAHLKDVGMAPYINAKPSQLSGGQKQRVGIARALASNPKVLLCDEATSALDPQTTKSILELLKDINQKMNLTIVLITHQMEVVKTICDRVAVIESGDIIEEGPMVDVFTNPQHPTTKEFTKSVINAELPDIVKKMQLSDTYTDGSKLLVRISFIGDSASEPIISGMVKHFDVDVSIISGNTDQLKDLLFGTLLIEVSGTKDGIKNALEYLHKQHLKTEVIGYES